MIGSVLQYEDVIEMSYPFFKGRLCTPEAIEQYLNLMKSTLDEIGISQKQAYNDLERLHTITMINSSSVLDNNNDHLEWFNISTNNGLQRNIEWHFWDHFKRYLTSRKHWPKGIVESIDRETSAIIARLEDPTRPGSWDRRGMVMGSVQSGKTANYTGLICKAIDSGYRLIVVLAGVHNSLRSQTQYRLNEEILGYDMGEVQEFRDQAERIGVRLMFPDHKIVQTLTSSKENGDFRKNVVEVAGIIPISDGPATIMVIKKHVSILKNLIDWSTSIIGQKDDSGRRRVVKDVPLLVIDDECDYASVNTRKVILDDKGNVDEECDPAKTNQRIRELLNSFCKSAYVGYTATPFANIFIHHSRKHPQYGDDLFPRNFILTLPQPANYVGPEQVFGLTEHPAAYIDEREPASLVRYIEDSNDIIPPMHKKDLIITRLPESLKEAVMAFMISCAIRKLRNSSPPHNSMLIHVTRFNLVQIQMHSLVENLLRIYVDKIRSGSDPLNDFRELWKNNFQPATESMSGEYGVIPHKWNDVVENLYPVARRIRVGLINGTSADSLSYRHTEMTAEKRRKGGESVSWEERGEHVIAIGGDKLSRGLTLDGLTVSYYLRASKMYDTLMQMGRWFGYRDGYIDVCRIYTTEELVEWYRFIASASIELRQELEYMSLINAEPKDFGLKVLDHPGQLAVTSAGKRRSAEELSLTYSGRISETIVFDLQHSASNLKALSRLIKDAKADGDRISKEDLYWCNVRPESVVRYLRAYKTQEMAARVVAPAKIAQFIEEQQIRGDRDLCVWNVAVLSRNNPLYKFDMEEEVIGCFERKPLYFNNQNMSIRRLVSPTDEWIDFDKDERRIARQRWAELREKEGKEPPKANELPSGPAIRSARPKERGLLLIYPICSNDSQKGVYGMEPGQEVTGFAVSFPASDTTHQVKYQVNSVFQVTED